MSLDLVNSESGQESEVGPANNAGYSVPWDQANTGAGGGVG